MRLQSTNADQNSLETVFSIAICRQSRQSFQLQLVASRDWRQIAIENYISTDFLYLLSSIVLTFSECRLFGVFTGFQYAVSKNKFTPKRW